MVAVKPDPQRWLDAQIQNAISNKSRLHSIFFDPENDFARVWKYHICKTLQTTGLTGPLLLLIQSFLEERSFIVRIGNHLLSIHSQDNGISQGSPLSGKLFMLAINDVVSTTPSMIKTILFADDLSIHLETRNSKRAQRLLQETTNLLCSWLCRYGFRISPSKTQMVIFSGHRTQTKLPLILVRGIPIPLLESVKFLVLRFQSNHSWILHIKIIKAKCYRAINILKSTPLQTLQSKNPPPLVSITHQVHPRLRLPHLRSCPSLPTQFIRPSPKHGSSSRHGRISNQSGNQPLC